MFPKEVKDRSSICSPTASKMHFSVSTQLPYTHTYYHHSQASLIVWFLSARWSSEG